MASQPISTTTDLQAVPQAFHDQLIQLRDAADPRLNAVLAAARSYGFHASTLGAIIGVTAAAASKRMERAAPPPWPLNMREKARVTERELHDIVRKHGIPGDDQKLLAEAEADIVYLLEVRIGDAHGVVQEDAVSVARSAVEKLGQLSAKATTPRAIRRWRTLRNRIEEAIDYVPGAPPIVSSVDPDAVWREMTGPAVEAAIEVARWFTATYPDLVGKESTAATEKLERLDRALAGLNTVRSVEQQRKLTYGAAAALSALKGLLPDGGDAAEAEWRLTAVRKLTRAVARLQMCAEFSPAGVEVEGVLIPLPPRVQRTQRGRTLPDETIALLRKLQRQARWVNGTTKPDSPKWAASQRLSDLLFELTHPSDGTAPYPAYYLAKILGVTHRAVIARLERRQPAAED